MDQPPLVVEIYYQTPGNIETTIFLKKETGRSQTPDMNADIITQFHSEKWTFGSGGTLVVFLADVLERLRDAIPLYALCGLVHKASKAMLRRPINTQN